jgi:predicted DCC family thiol-disulfide oxidoreductase YuxK
MSEYPGMNPARNDPPVILFDGVCNLCNRGVRWIIRRDRRAVFRFAALQSAAGRKLLVDAGRTEELPGSMILIDQDGVHERSDAAIRIAAYLGFPWSLAKAARILPRFLRDGLYRWVARNRYRWFGKRDTCTVPEVEVRERFLDAGEVPGSAAAGCTV